MFKKLAALLVLAAPAVTAQSTFGVLLGTVTDESGAIVPHAKITITNQGENVSHETMTDAQGTFEALNLKAGTYTVTAEAAGFKAFKSSNLDLAARQTLRVNVTLQLGAVQETVSVEGAAPVIATDSAAISASFHSQEVLQLPANYRGAGSTSPYALLAYQTGIQSDNGNGFSLQGGLPAQAERSPSRGWASPGWRPRPTAHRMWRSCSRAPPAPRRTSARLPP